MSEEARNGTSSCFQNSGVLVAIPKPTPVVEEPCEEEGSNTDGGDRRWTSRVRQWLIIFFVSTGSWSFGCMIAFASVMAQDLRQNTTTLFGFDLNLTGRQLDMLSSLFVLGTVIGSVGTGPVISAVGRRLSLALATVVVLIGWIGVALIPVYSGIIVARVIGGVGSGGCIVTVATYLVELAPSKKRGMASGMSVLGFMAGQLAMSVIGYGKRYYVAAGLASLIPTIVLLLLFVLPESPAFLALKGKTMDAKKLLKNFREPSDDLDAEISRYISAAAEASDKNKWRGLLNPNILKPLMTFVVLFIFTLSTGGIATVANSSRLLRMTCSSWPDDTSSIVILAAQLAATCASIFLVDKIGRKTLLLLGYLAMAVALGGLTAYSANIDVIDALDSSNQTTYYFEGNMSNSVQYGATLTPEDDDIYPGEAVVTVEEHQCASGSWIPLVCLVIAQVGFGSGVLPMPYVLGNETFPSWIRPQACGIIVGSGTLTSVIVLQIFTPMLEAFTLAGLFGAYAIVSLSGFLFVMIFVKETKNSLLK